MSVERVSTNITVKVDRDVLVWARMRALQYGVSVNRHLEDALLELARRPRPPYFPPPPDRLAPPPTPWFLDEGPPALEAADDPSAPVEPLELSG